MAHLINLDTETWNGLVTADVLAYSFVPKGIKYEVGTYRYG